MAANKNITGTDVVCDNNSLWSNYYQSNNVINQ